MMAEAVLVTVDDRGVRVEASADGVAVDGHATTIASGPADGEIVLRRGERQTRLFAVNAGDVTWVFHEGRTYEATVEAEGAARRRTPHAHGSLMAPMPATVIAVNVTPGDAVKSGDVLVLLEAMKMELPLRAEGAGVVAAVHCRAGDLVQPNVPLVDLE
jgi:biotin carboxyl carrier protein